MKQRTKRAAAVLLATISTAFAGAAAAQSTDSPKEGGVYQYGDANRTNGDGNERMPQNSDARRQSGYPQPGTAADATGMATGRGTTQDTNAPPTTNSATPGK